MAGKKPKTAWGRAYSQRFKELKRAWDKSKKVGGTTVRTWKSAFTVMGRIARKHADSKASNPIARKRQKTKAKAKPKAARKAKKAARKVKSAAGRIFSALKGGAGKPKPKPSAGATASLEVVEIKLAGGKLVNVGQQAGRLVKDGSRERITGGTWAPEASRIGKARKLREALVGQGVRFSRLTVLVDGKRQERKRKGRARFSDGRLYLE